MSNITVHREVRLGEEGQWQLCFQWCTYVHEDDSPNEDGYRFIWRRPDGSLQAARGQARIPSAADILALLHLAAREGWLTTVEQRGARAEFAGEAG